MHHRMKMRWLCLWALMLAWPAAARAEIELPALFNDHMVLQRQAPILFWGRAEPGEWITVSVAGAAARGRVADDGRWRIMLPPLEAGGPHTVRIEAAAGPAVQLQNVLIGEVWLCSGQSNMQWPLSRSHDAEREIQSADYERIRLFSVPLGAAGEPQDDVDAEWEVCSPRTIGGFSAVGYFFGRKLHEELDVPIGLINCSYGGSAAEAWISYPALAAEPALQPLLERWRRTLAEWDPEAARQRYEERLAEWERQAEQARAEGKEPSRRPRAPSDPHRSNHRPAALYNAMLHPLLPYSLRGTIWYQGESNAGRARQYRTIFPMLIRHWRRELRHTDMPFYFVQLANFMQRRDQPADSAWAELREAQLYTHETLPRTGMAVIIDIGEADDIHPRNKQDVGDRLARWALAHDYGRDVVTSGPIYRSMEQSGGRIVLHFDHTDGGLVARGGEKLTGFAIAGEDRRFVWADARIEGQTVIVSSDKVPDPVAVRYAWADNPECNLYNAAGLPASPFRTDAWPGVTDDNQ